MMPRLSTLVEPIVVGAAVGAIRHDDHKNAATRTKMSKQYGTWVELGGALLGFLGQTGGFLPGNISTLLVDYGLAFGTERLIRAQLSGTGLNTPAPMSVTGRAYASPFGLSSPMAAPFAQKEYSLTTF